MLHPETGAYFGVGTPAPRLRPLGFCTAVSCLSICPKWSGARWKAVSEALLKLRTDASRGLAEVLGGMRALKVQPISLRQ
eukprot:1449606-Alexandrium_andersonii.AAC.1